MFCVKFGLLWRLRLNCTKFIFHLWLLGKGHDPSFDKNTHFLYQRSLVEIGHGDLEKNNNVKSL